MKVSDLKIGMYVRCKIAGNEPICQVLDCKSASVLLHEHESNNKFEVKTGQHGILVGVIKYDPVLEQTNKEMKELRENTRRIHEKNIKASANANPFT